MTRKDYRARADQYFEWVHNAKTSYERRVYLKLARAWLQAALAEDDAAPAPVMPPAPRLPRVTFARPQGGDYQLTEKESPDEAMRKAVGTEEASGGAVLPSPSNDATPAVAISQVGGCPA